MGKMKDLQIAYMNGDLSKEEYKKYLVPN